MPVSMPESSHPSIIGAAVLMMLGSTRVDTSMLWLVRPTAANSTSTRKSPTNRAAISQVGSRSGGAEAPGGVRLSRLGDVSADIVLLVYWVRTSARKPLRFVCSLHLSLLPTAWPHTCSQQCDYFMDTGCQESVLATPNLCYNAETSGQLTAAPFDPPP